jgi:hypothetical protein
MSIYTNMHIWIGSDKGSEYDPNIEYDENNYDTLLYSDLYGLTELTPPTAALHTQHPLKVNIHVRIYRNIYTYIFIHAWIKI